MQSNAEKTEEVVFSTKRVKPQHPPLNLGSDEIASNISISILGLSWMKS